MYDKEIVENLTKQKFCFDLILISFGIKLLQGHSGIHLLRRYLWNNVSYNTKANMKIALFTHLHNLSLRWHLSRKTGSVLGIMDRGVQSIGMLLEYLLFRILPLLIDIPIAFICIIKNFSALFGLVIFITMIILVVTRIKGK